MGGVSIFDDPRVILVMVAVSAAIVIIGLAVKLAARALGFAKKGSLVGPSPGADRDRPEAAFVSREMWFTVEVWPALAPGWLFRGFFADSRGLLAVLIFVVPSLAILARIDRRYKVCIYRGKKHPPWVRLIHVEYLPSEADAEARQDSLISNWDPTKFLDSEPLSRRQIRTLRKDAPSLDHRRPCGGK